MYVALLFSFLQPGKVSWIKTYEIANPIYPQLPIFGLHSLPIVHIIIIIWTGSFLSNSGKFLFLTTVLRHYRFINLLPYM